ncbi:MAG: hypothetical protein IJU77_01715 [Butyrivibrio sp.]|nr:hypothetical protein [Butyrivibrio sp.]
MIRKNLMKSLSVIMAAMMAIMTVGCGKISPTAAVQSAVESAVDKKVEESIEKSLMNASSVASSASEAGKVETVYVTADANGAVNDVIVSEWLKNVTASPELADSTELKNIVNVKGSETYTDNGDGTLTWNTEGSDIYYQGTTEKELPVKMNITYTLDGKEISPEELAGKSGRVTMRFEYENNAKQTVEVNGKDIEVYTPFAMVSGMMLDSDKFTNVEISNGKVISDGGKYVVMGVATPGLKESLNISDEKWDKLEDADEIKEKLSNSFEVTADTSDFELGMTITMASSDILADFGISDLSDSDKINDIKGDMGKLQDGSKKLVDGTQTLKDGTKELRDGTGKLFNGTTDLEDGARKLYSGATELSDGTSKLFNGTVELSDGASKLYEGTGTLANGTDALASGSSKLYEGVKAYTDGAAKINSGAASLATGLETAKNGSATLKKSMDDKHLVESANQISQGAEKVTSSLNGLGAKIDGMSKAMAGLAELQTMNTQVSSAKAYLEGSGDWSDATAAGMVIISGGNVANKETADALIAGASATASGAVSVGEGAEKLSTGAAQVDAGIKQLSAGLSQLDSQLNGETASNTVTVTQDENQSENVVDVEGDTLTNPDNTDEETVEEKTEENNKEEVYENTGSGAGDTDNTTEETYENTGSCAGDTDNTTEETYENTNNGSGDDDKSTEETYQNTNSDAGDGNNSSSDNEVIKQVGNAVDLGAAVQNNGENLDDEDEDILAANLIAASKVADGSSNADKAALLAGLDDSKSVVLDDSQVIITKDELEAYKQYAAFYQAYGSVVKEQLPQMASAIRTMSQKVQDLSDGSAALSQGAAELSARSSKLPQGVEAVAAYNQLMGSASGILGAISQVQSKIAASGMSFDENTVTELKKSLEQLQMFAAGSGQMASGVVSIYDATSKIDAGLGQLSSGANELANGTKTLTSKNGELVDGAAQLSDGAGKLNGGANELKDGAGKLSSGAGELKDGAGKLNSGAGELRDGVGKLSNGATDLKDGAGKLNDGAISLDDGVQQLLDGVVKLDKEGISKIYEAFDGDLTEFADRVTAIQEAGSSYKSFGGSSDDVDSSVKFIIKTDSIKEL